MHVKKDILNGTEEELIKLTNEGKRKLAMLLEVDFETKEEDDEK